MMKVTIKVHAKRFTIPVSYALLHLSIRILTSKKFLTYVNREIEKKAKIKFQFPTIHKDDLKSLITELSKQKGLLLVETSLKDGTEVSITL